MWLFSEPHVDVPFKLVVLPSIPLESVSSTEFVGKKWPNKTVWISLTSVNIPDSWTSSNNNQ